MHTLITALKSEDYSNFLLIYFELIQPIRPQYRKARYRRSADR